jgi:hypothetical protein
VKAYVAKAVVLLLAFIIASQPVAALNVTGIPFVTTDNAVFTFPVCSNGLTILEFNSARITTAHASDLDISFPAFADGLHLGPATAGIGAGVGINGGIGVGADDNNTAGVGAGTSPAGVGVGVGLSTTANVLPFGPVNLAFPSISQTLCDSCDSQRTYFFTDTF